jgi:hypothetical protein
MTVHRAMTVDCTVTVHRAVPYKGGRSYCTVERAVSGERGKRSRHASVCLARARRPIGPDNAALGDESTLAPRSEDALAAPRNRLNQGMYA